jgi:hypothetical protein
VTLLYDKVGFVCILRPANRQAVPRWAARRYTAGGCCSDRNQPQY